jgi:hypothetical protein
VRSRPSTYAAKRWVTETRLRGVSEGEEVREYMAKKKKKAAKKKTK